MKDSRMKDFIHWMELDLHSRLELGQWLVYNFCLYIWWLVLSLNLWVLKFASYEQYSTYKYIFFFIRKQYATNYSHIKWNQFTSNNTNSLPFLLFLQRTQFVCLYHFGTFLITLPYQKQINLVWRSTFFHQKPARIFHLYRLLSTQYVYNLDNQYIKTSYYLVTYIF